MWEVQKTHADTDVGTRAMQEQLPRSSFLPEHNRSSASMRPRYTVHPEHKKPSISWVLSVRVILPRQRKLSQHKAQEPLLKANGGLIFCQNGTAHPLNFEQLLNGLKFAVGRTPSHNSLRLFQTHPL